MVREIKTTLAIDGEKRFKEALASANREMQVMNADLRAMAAEFSSTDDAQKYFAQRSDMLNDKVKQQEQIVEALNQAVKDSVAKYGDAARQTDEYRIKLSNATASLFKMRQEAEEAGRELEDLGRDGNKIGRQLENGIGDAAEEVSEKLDGMFAKVSADVNALKGSVAFQTAMDVGGFVMEGIQSVMGFVQENDEYNRQIAIARHNVEKYGHNWDEALDMIIDAAAITGNREGAYEAISNLTSAAVEDQNLIGAAVDALLGVFLTTGGALSFESLAEDFRASVVSRVPTGTYAEVLEEILQDIVLEDVQKAMESVETVDDAFNVALAYLTEGGFQTTTKTFEEKEQEFLESQRKQQELAAAWAELAKELTPVVTGFVDATTTVVTGLTSAAKVIKDGAKSILALLQDEVDELLGKAVNLGSTAYTAVELKRQQESIIENGGELTGVITENAAQKLAEELGSFADIVSRTAEENAAIIAKYDMTADGVAEVVDGLAEILGYTRGEEGLTDYWGRYGKMNDAQGQNAQAELQKLIDEANLPSLFESKEVTATYEAAGAETFHAYEEGFLSASEESTAAEQTVMGFMVDLMAGEQEAWDIGKNAMINFASGIVEGGKVAISSAAEVVTTINAILAQINVWQLAYAGIVNGSLHIGRDDLVNTVSHGMRQRVDIKNYLK